MKRNVLGLLAAATIGVVGAGAMGQNVVISQIYGGGGATTGTPTYTHDYVELLNTGPAAVDINGWSLQYASATGSTWSGTGLTVLATTSTILQPGQYYLVRLGTATGALGAALPVAHDASGTTAMSATSGKVAVVSNSTALTGTCPTGVIDFVGYGTTANCREPFLSSLTADNAPAPTSSAFGLVRLLDGCFDTNRNRFDLVNQLNPVPRNSMSPFATCGASADLGIANTAGGACPTTVGASASYGFSITNSGGTASDATVTVNVPAGFNFVGSTPSGTFSMGTLTVNLGSIAPNGGSAALTVDVTVASAGSHQLLAAVSGTVTDPVTINDTVASAVAYVPTSGTALKGVFSNISTAANSVVPTGVSAASNFLFSATSTQDIFGRPWVSSNGRWLILKAKNSLGTTLDDMLVRVDLMTNTASVVAQEGATDLGDGELLGAIDFQPTVNNSGDFAYSGLTSAAAAINDVAIKNIGGTNTVIGREGSADGFGSTIATSVTAWDILNNGDAVWGHLLTSTATNDLESIIRHSTGGDSLLARANDGGTTTAPTGQVGGSSFLWRQFDSGSALGGVNQVSPDGANVLLSGILEGGATDPDAVAVNGAIAVMDGQSLGTTTGTVTTITGSSLRGSNWMSYGSNSTGDDWALHNGNVVAQTGGPIHTGAMETWGDSSFSATFFIAAANAVGDYVVGGVTDAADDNANAVLVLNNSTVVVRENDPVDLDGNGVFDDDAYIRTFRDNRIYLTDDRVLYFAVETRSVADYCSGNAKTADVLVRLQLPGGNGACCCGSTCTLTTAAACVGDNTVFSGAGTACNAPGNVTAPCCLADFNKAGGIGVQDIFDFLAAYFGGNGCADFNGGGIGVQDIFDFLAAYFGGGC